MKVKTSIIVPVYNVERYLPECLDSLLAQPVPDMEIIAVNDGSTDGSRKILENYQAEDSRIRLIDKQNGGLSDARNFGLDAAAGDYIACVDSDDRIRPDMITSLTETLEKTDSDMAVSDMEYFYENGSAQRSDGGRFDCTDIHAMPSLIAINNSACNKLFRKELFDGIRFPVGRYYEDLATVPILIYRAKKVVKVNAPLYAYRQRTGSIAHTASPKIFDIYDAIDDVMEYVKKHGNEPEILAELRHLYIVHGLDLTTLRIRDFDDRELREGYLKENMRRLRRSYPEFVHDDAIRKAGWRKKIIFRLLEQGKMKQVLRLYDR